MLSKMFPCHLNPRERTRGKVTKIRNLEETKATEVVSLMLIKGNSVISQPSNRANNPSRTRPFKPIDLVLVTVLMAIILVTFPFSFRCAKNGKIKKFPLEGSNLCLHLHLPLHSQ